MLTTLVHKRGYALRLTPLPQRLNGVAVDSLVDADAGDILVTDPGTPDGLAANVAAAVATAWRCETGLAPQPAPSRPLSAPPRASATLPVRVTLSGCFPTTLGYPDRLEGAWRRMARRD